MLEFPATIFCYCGVCFYPLTLFAPSNRATCDICHCTSCRRWSGGLFTAAVCSSPIPSCLLSSGALTGYVTSPGTTRYFLVERHAGVVEDWGGLEIQVGEHEWVRDTRDGGGAEFWENGMRWAGKKGESEQLPLGWRAPQLELEQPDGEADDTLVAECHCGGVSFLITRPTSASKTAIPTGWPSVLPDPTGSTHDWDSEPCGQPVDLRKLGTLRSCTPARAEGVHRDFCGRCGASVFWWNEARDAVIDVAPGILRAPEGARAESWLEWVGEGVVRDGEGRGPRWVCEALGRGVRAFGERRRAGKAVDKEGWSGSPPGL
ncbi:hypothetical protein CALCODRAFT_480292 [Calocera cornea HHB12733]|uniref:CENP-V/GFA domain-containing protein n=1 Tax=Calocera cornea HHB12733 TaxID=1353952 RepID=A0A165IRP7_9BASI|nr:hypothetical protein CALCODRAFT_480292 [Calocera cornea HHB12733]